MNECTLPPKGWCCSREAGHAGPCATRAHSCPVCPTQIRNLFATAHNLVAAYERGIASWYKIAVKIDQLKEAVKSVQPLVDKHFEEM